MHVLLTNDDGIYAPGLWAIYDHMAARHTVTVVAPDRERSAIGHAITLHAPLRARRVSLNGGPAGTAVDGTPADCIKFALVEVLGERPDLVISGINPGANVGVNINYSGTVAAAKEATLYGVPAMAVSVRSRQGRHMADAARFARQLAERIHHHGLPQGTFLNVNIPDLPLRQIRDVRISRQATGRLAEYFEKRTDPRQGVYYWQGSDTQRFAPDADLDGTALDQDCISITPLKCDQTAYDMLGPLQSWDLDLAPPS